MATNAPMLMLALLALLLATLSTGLRLPQPPLPPIAPLSKIPPGILGAGPGNFVSLGSFGVPIGISGTLFNTLQGDLLGLFSSTVANLAPAGAGLKGLLTMVEDRWTTSLVKAQYSPGFQGFINLFPGKSFVQEKLTKAVCMIYPWDLALPSVAKVFKDSYCIKAVPANIVSNVVKGPSKLGPGLGLPGVPGPVLLG